MMQIFYRPRRAKGACVNQRAPMRWAFLIALFLASVAQAQAPTHTWISPTSGLWSQPSRWLGNNPPPIGGGTGEILQFTAFGVASYSATDDSSNATVVNGLIFDNGGFGIINVNKQSGPTPVLRLVANGAASPFINQNGGGDVTFSASQQANMNLDFAATVTFGGANTGAITIDGSITGVGGLMKTSPGTLNLNGSVALAGNIAISEGTFQVAGPKLTLSASSSFSVVNGAIAKLSGDYSMPANSTMHVSDFLSELDVTSAGILQVNHGSQITVDAGGALTAPFLFIGTAGNGAVVVDGDSSSLAVTLAGTTTKLGQNGGTGTLTLSNHAIASLGGISLAQSGTDNSVGLLNILSGAELTVGNVTAGTGGKTGQSAVITMQGAGTILSQTASSVMTLGAASGSTATLNIKTGATFTAGGGGTVLNSTGVINLNGGSASLGPLIQNGGSISFTAGSLTFGGSLTVGSAGLLGSNVTLSSNRSLTLTGITTIDPGHMLTLSGGSLTTAAIINGGVFSYVSGNLNLASAGGVTLAPGGGAFSVNTGSTLSLSKPIDGTGGLTKSGGGTLALSGSLTYAGATTVAAGKLRFTDSPHLTSLSIADGATVEMTTGGHKVLELDALSIGSIGALELANNDLIVHSDDQNRDAVLSQITSLIKSGRNSGAWNGTGIRSSAAANQAAKIAGLAVILNDDGTGKTIVPSLDGRSVDIFSILVKYTFAGDLDLSGAIDADDYFLIDRGFVQHLAGYRNGDLDFNGTVDADDYFLIDKAFALQGSSPPGRLDVSATAVPEPGSLAILSALLSMIGTRRSRRIDSSAS
jgi:autotransporter-associated beta strand protein